MAEHKRARRVALIDRVPSFRAGLEAELEGLGLEVTQLEELPDLRGGGEFELIAVSVQDLSTWTQLRDLGLAVGSVVALCSQLDPELWSVVLADGAAGIADRTAPPGVLAAAIDAADRGELRLPIEFVRSLVRSVARDVGPDLTPDEIRWLRKLSNGVSIRVLHTAEYLSERELHRRLQKLYLRMGVTNRDQAVAKAARLGVID